MICDNCKNERLITDFINNQKFCYQCTYRIKLEKIKKKQPPKVLFCRVCKEEIINNNSSKTKHRSVFCSEACADIGHRESRRSYWTRHVGYGRGQKLFTSGDNHG